MGAIGTVRLQGLLDFLRIDAVGHSKPSDARVFSNEAGEPIQSLRRSAPRARPQTKTLRQRR
jgi:hypothetical protein